MQRIRQHSPFADAISSSLTTEPFRLVVVGAAGDALDQGWESFGGQLSALVLVQAADGASGLASNPRLQVVAADLTSPGPFWAAPPFGRFSDARARYLAGQSIGGAAPEALDAWLQREVTQQPQFEPENTNYQAVFAREPSPLLAVIDGAGFAEADFLQFPGGWSDFDLLAGLGPLLQRPTLQGVELQVHLHGSHDARENTFHNVDRLMRQRGFDLFGLEPVTYSSAALPWPFLDRHPAQAEGGRVLHARALYVRDLARAGEGQAAARVLKAAAIRAMYGMPDQAAELLVLFRDVADKVIDVDAALDMLAFQLQENQGTRTRHSDYIASFEAGEQGFYNLYEQRDRWFQGLMQTSREAPLKIADLEERIRQLAAELRRARGEGGMVKAKSWFGGRGGRRGFDVNAIRQRLTQRSEAHPGHHWIFDHYGPWRGPVTEGLGLVDYIGAATSPEVGVFLPTPASPNFVAAMPRFDEEYFEWTDLLEAVQDADDTFTMLELGAGYGRWSARGALAARRLGKKVKLGVAEAEPRHIMWLRSHFARNGVNEADYTIFPTAVGGSVGSVVFAIEAPADLAVDNWFGQAILPLEVAGTEPKGDYFGLPTYAVDGWKLIVVPQVPLSDVLKAYQFVDIADFDLQGSEADAIQEAIKPLTAKVRRLHIGTHGHDIEARLREILGGAGWVCLQDYECHGTHGTPYGPVAFVDGVQSWINPALW